MCRGDYTNALIIVFCRVFLTRCFHLLCKENWLLFYFAAGGKHPFTPYRTQKYFKKNLISKQNAPLTHKVRFNILLLEKFLLSEQNAPLTHEVRFNIFLLKQFLLSKQIAPLTHKVRFNILLLKKIFSVNKTRRLPMRSVLLFFSKNNSPQ